MPEIPAENLDSAREMAIQLRNELDSFKNEQELADLWFSKDNEASRDSLARIREGWEEQNIINVPMYIPPTDIPGLEEIAEADSPFKLDFYIDILMNAIRFLRLLGSVKNDFSPSDGPKLDIEILGDDIDKLGNISTDVRRAVAGVMPFRESTNFSCPEGTKGPAREVVSFRYIDGFDKELQDAVVRTRLSLLFENVHLDFSDEKIVIKID